MRETVNVLVTNGQASEPLKQLVPTERLPGAAIANILEKRINLMAITHPRKCMSWLLVWIRSHKRRCSPD